MNNAERMAQIIYETPLDPEDNPSPWPPSHPEDLRWWLSRGEALVQSGIGDVSAERERANKAERSLRETAAVYLEASEGRAAFREERDRLQARADAAEVAARRSEGRYGQAAGERRLMQERWSEMRTERDSLQARIKAAMRIRDPREFVPIGGSERLLAYREGYQSAWDDFRAALTEDQPAATPEPPKLDPAPWVGRVTGHRYSAGKGDPGIDRFAPRPEFEQDPAKYEVQS